MLKICPSINFSIHLSSYRHELIKYFNVMVAIMLLLQMCFEWQDIECSVLSVKHWWWFRHFCQYYIS